MINRAKIVTVIIMLLATALPIFGNSSALTKEEAAVLTVRLMLSSKH